MIVTLRQLFIDKVLKFYKAQGEDCPLSLPPGNGLAKVGNYTFGFNGPDDYRVWLKVEGQQDELTYGDKSFDDALEGLQLEVDKLSDPHAENRVFVWDLCSRGYGYTTVVARSALEALIVLKPKLSTVHINILRSTQPTVLDTNTVGFYSSR